MPPTYRLNTIEHAVEIATQLTRSWFRGHSRAVGQLTPRIFRADISNEFVDGFRPDLELAMIDSFKREAPALAEVALPKENDRLGWLYVMRHYRTPTRLLDWSKNLLVALFFAVNSDHGEDGELWAMYPTKLNEQSHIGLGLPLVNSNPVVSFLIDQPYWAGSAETLAEQHGIATIPIGRWRSSQPAGSHVWSGKLGLSRFTLGHSRVTRFRIFSLMSGTWYGTLFPKRRSRR